MALADITWIGVVVTGTMGAGITEMFAEAGYAELVRHGRIDDTIVCASVLYGLLSLKTF